MRDVIDDAVVDEQHLASPAGNACNAILVNGYIIISTDCGVISCWSPVERTVVHSSQLPMPVGSDACPRLLQHMQQAELLVGLDDGAAMHMDPNLHPHPHPNPNPSPNPNPNPTPTPDPNTLTLTLAPTLPLTRRRHAYEATRGRGEEAPRP